MEIDIHFVLNWEWIYLLYILIYVIIGMFTSFISILVLPIKSKSIWWWISGIFCIITLPIYILYIVYNVFIKKD